MFNSVRLNLQRLDYSPRLDPLSNFERWGHTILVGPMKFEGVGVINVV